MVASAGFEPTSRESKSPILPLDDKAIFCQDDRTRTYIELLTTSRFQNESASNCLHTLIMSKWRGSNSRSLGPKPSGLPAFPHFDENPTCQITFYLFLLGDSQKTKNPNLFLVRLGFAILSFYSD